MKNEVKGKIIQVLPIQRGESSRGSWVRSGIVIEYEDGRYTNKLCLECSGQKAEAFGGLHVGQTGTFFYDVTSREYNGRWYHSVNCFDWQVDGVGSADPI